AGNHPEAGIAGRNGGGAAARAIAGAVVDEEAFEVGGGLGGDAAQGIVDGRGGVAKRQDDADAGEIAHAARTALTRSTVTAPMKISLRMRRIVRLGSSLTQIVAVRSRVSSSRVAPIFHTSGTMRRARKRPAGTSIGSGCPTASLTRKRDSPVHTS